MLSNTNILALIFSILPALIYGYIIFIHAPTKTIKINKLIVYTLIGFLSITFLRLFQFAFPSFQEPLFREIIGMLFTINGYEFVFIDTIMTVFFFAFVQVALVEELCKWLSFKAGNIIRGRSILRDHPYAIMFYLTMAAAGFASIENISYASNAIKGVYGADTTVVDVLLIRSMSTVIVHMVCGLIMGYFISIATKLKGWHRLKFWSFGILFATIFHGIYDFFLMYDPISTLRVNIGGYPINWLSLILVVGGLVVSYFLARDIRKRKIKRKKVTRKKIT